MPPLRAALHALRAAGVDTEIGVAGCARDVRAEAAEALVRAVRVTAAEAVRDGRARVVALRVTFAADRVEVVIRDDGADATARPATVAMGQARRRLEAFGGGIEIARGRRTGSVVRAWVR